MRRTALLVLFPLLYCGILTAQTDSIPRLVSRLEASGDNKTAVNTITGILNNRSLSEEDRLALQTTLIHKYQELQQWDICLSYCQQQVAAAHAQNNALAEASFYKMIGNTYYHIPDKDKAVQYWKKCIEISEPAGFTLLLEQCYHNLGSVYLERSEHYDQAEKYLQQSVKFSIANKTDGLALGRLHYRLLATLYERTNRLSKALDAYADVISKSRQAKDSSNLAEALMFSSDVLLKQKKFTEALEVSSEALEIARKVARLDMVRTALDFYSMNLYAAGKYKEAYLYKNEAAQISLTRYNSDLNEKLSEAEAKFKTAEAGHEKELALIKERKEKQLYVLGLIGLFAVTVLLFYHFYQKRSATQKAQLQEEKERLSRDLHDNLGSQMALLSNTVETLDTHFRRQQDIEGNIEKVKETSRRLLQTLRETIWILNKEQVQAQEFFDKLVDYTQRYLQLYSSMVLQAEEHFAGNKALSSGEALQLFRICQEAVTNACKYSGSPTLMLKGAATENSFTITVSDKGRGFNAAAAAGNGHYGLANMRQRAKAIQALLLVDTAEDKGTAISVTVESA